MPTTDPQQRGPDRRDGDRRKAQVEALNHDDRRKAERRSGIERRSD
jgi:hypothetical protein